MEFFTRYLLVAGDSFAFWAPASAAAFFCLLSVDLLGIAAIFIRVYGKIKLTNRLGWDDLFMLLAGASAVSYTIMAVFQIRYGLSVPIQNRPYEVQLRYQVVNYAGRVFYLSGLTWFKATFSVHDLSFNVERSTGDKDSSNIGICVLLCCRGHEYRRSTESVSSGVTTEIGILLQLMYGLITMTSTCFDILCFSLPFLFMRNQHLSRAQRNHRRGWMYVTFATTFASLVRAFSIGPATAIYTAESESLVVMGSLELHMGIVSTSVPSWYMWMDLSRNGKKRFRDYQPTKFFARLFLPLMFPIYRWCYPLCSKIIAWIGNKVATPGALKLLRRIQDSAFFQIMFWYADANFVEKAIGGRPRLIRMALTIRRWLKIIRAVMSHRIRSFLGMDASPYPGDEFELEYMGGGKKGKRKGKGKAKRKPKANSDSDIPTGEERDGSHVLKPLIRDYKESYMSRRNYNILFTSDKTLDDMLRDEELEYIDSTQWEAFNREGMDFRLRENLAALRDQYIDGILYDELKLTGRLDRKVKKRSGLRRRK
ncbi:hypothetical protein TWF718_001255 [Orbilia javanica]|uniref:Uncharacterized protein n=1 Tax=Orbilia javanica TaxID=47235 RepID=A0AAN8MV42_9PEZI